MNHILQVKEYAPSVKNVFVGILLFHYLKEIITQAVVFGDSFFQTIPDERAIRTLIQCHGKCGYFSRPIELLKQMPRSQWKSEQNSRLKKIQTAFSIIIHNIEFLFQKQSQLSRIRIQFFIMQVKVYHTLVQDMRKITHGLISALNNHPGLMLETLLRYGYPS